MQVSMKEAACFDLSSSLSPRLLQLEWTKPENKPQPLVQKLLLEGTEGTKFLTIRQSTNPIGMHYIELTLR